MNGALKPLALICMAGLLLTFRAFGVRPGQAQSDLAVVSAASYAASRVLAAETIAAAFGANLSTQKAWPPPSSTDAGLTARRALSRWRGLTLGKTALPPRRSNWGRQANRSFCCCSARAGAFTAACRPSRRAFDLTGKYVIPPFAEAHNHNYEDAKLRQYLREGIFYVKVPNNLPADRPRLAGRINLPGTLEMTFAHGGLTAAGGHPLGIVRRNIERGAWTEAQGEGAFYFTINNAAELAAKWDKIKANRKDSIEFSPYCTRRLQLEDCRTVVPGPQLCLLRG